ACQVGVSLTVATATEHLPIDFELSLPRCWADDEARRKEARIPDDVTLKPKGELGLARRLLANGKFQRCTWREGTRGELSANVALVRVVPCKDARNIGRA
ncbi:MAG: transposase, partial [Deltaproteobacteria bacterium]|nr:transposase [Deltaproteobacteria bacterium]